MLPLCYFKVSYNRFTFIKGKAIKHFSSYALHITSFHKESENSSFEDSISLNLSFSKSLLWSDWSDDPGCCDWSTAYSVSLKRNASHHF